MGSDAKKYIKRVLKYLRDLADPPDSFVHRETKHHVVSLSLLGEKLTWTFPKTPSDYRSRKNISTMIRRDLRRVGAVPDRALLGFLTEDIVRRDQLVEDLLSFLDSEAKIAWREETGG